MKTVDKTVVIGNTTDRCYIENKVHKKDNYSIESPFLPPNEAEELTLCSVYPQTIHTFLNTHSPIITANAFVPSLLENSKDLYGFDMCIDLIKELKQTHPNIGLLFGIAKIETNEQKNYFETIKQQIVDLELQNHFYFFINDHEFWPLIKKSNIFVRPTLSDSFGISVQEAIALNVPAIASDVCIRPKKTILFKTGNVKDFIKIVKKVMS